MRNNGRNYSRKNDRVYPIHSYKTKWGKFKTIWKYKKPSYKKSASSQQYAKKYRYIPALSVPIAPFLFLVGVAILVYLSNVNLFILLDFFES